MLKYVIKHWSIVLILLTFICSCSDQAPNSDKASHSDTYCGITILNGGPKGSGYTDATGKKFLFRIFRARVINDTIIPIELTINFPGNPVALLPRSESYLRIFLLGDTTTLDKPDDYNYGVTGVKSFLDTDLNKSTLLKITILPNEEYILHIGVLSDPGAGRTLSKLFINGQDLDISFLPVKPVKINTKNRNKLDLVFGIGINPPRNYSLIPCGQIVFKK